MGESATYSDDDRIAYEAEREKCLQKIRGGMSASLSGIEYYPFPWSELPEGEREYFASCRRQRLNKGPANV